MEIDSYNEDKRLEVFMESTPLVFESREECVRHEMEYE